eukprot:tig00000492_g1544.t1
MRHQSLMVGFAAAALLYLVYTGRARKAALAFRRAVLGESLPPAHTLDVDRTPVLEDTGAAPGAPPDAGRREGTVAPARQEAPPPVAPYMGSLGAPIPPRTVVPYSTGSEIGVYAPPTLLTSPAAADYAFAPVAGPRPTY